MAKTIFRCFLKIMYNINLFHQKPSYIPPKIKAIPFSELQLGKRINSGIQSSVYKLKGFDSLVVKTNSFNPKSLKWDIDSFTHRLMLSSENSTIVMEKVAGKPLFGKDWQMTVPPFVTYYKYQLLKMLAIPEEAYLDYIQKVVSLRKNGYKIDYVNPNNILYDKKAKRFNIVDIGKGESNDSNTLDVKYLGPFWDDVRLLNTYDNANSLSKIEIACLVKKLMNKLCKIADKNGYKINIEDKNDYSYQRPSICFFHDQKKRIDKCLKDPYFREIYLIRLDD